MTRLMQTIFSVKRYADPLDRERARILYIITTVLLVFGIFFAFLIRTPWAGLALAPELGAITLARLAQVSPYVATAMIAFFGMGAAAYLLTRRGYLTLANWLPLLMYYAIAVYVYLPSGLPSPTISANYVALVVGAGLLVRERGLAAMYVFTLVNVAIGYAQRANLPENNLTFNSATDFINIFMILTGIALLTWQYLRLVRISRRAGFAAASEERIKLAELTTQVATTIMQRADLDSLLERIVDQIRGSFEHIYHAQVFLVEETPAGKSARLAASTGEVGKLLLQRQHSLPVGSVSVIGRVTQTGEPVIARSGSANSVHRRNEFLPDTAVEAAFPLRRGDQIIGALDLQSKSTLSFPDSDTPIYQSLADSVALAIENARLFEESELRIIENQRLVEQTRGALREVEQLNERLTGRAWAEYLTARRDSLTMSMDFINDVLSDETQPTPALYDAVRHKNLVQTHQNDKQIIAVPLTVRGQVIGAMEFELDAERGFSPEDLSLIQEVSERFGLAAENTRLLEDSQRVAQREALVNEISRRLQATNNIESTLTEAARSLQDALKAARVAIRLGDPPPPNGSSSGATGSAEGGQRQP